MVHLYELASDYGLKIPAKFFTDVYLIEKKMEKPMSAALFLLTITILMEVAGATGSVKNLEVQLIGIGHYRILISKKNFP